MMKITQQKKKSPIYAISISTNYYYYLPDDIDIDIAPIEPEDIVAPPVLPGCKVNFINPVDACPL